MRTCPTCNRAYADETLRFCLDDGAPLSYALDSEATRVIQPQQILTLPTTEVWRQPLETNSHNVSHRNTSTYLLVAVVALLAGGGLVWLLLSNGRAKSPADLRVNDRMTNADRQQQYNAQSNPPEAPRATNMLTERSVQDLINRWVRAQNEKDLRSYESCYGPSFEGIKRTKSGRSYSYDFNGWMKDRWKMISVAVGLNLEVKNMRISVDGDSANVEFDQYYHSLRYSDWGPKVVTVKLTPAGEKIVYEELKASYPL